jgi:pyruvate dehydrogenase E1 component
MYLLRDGGPDAKLQLMGSGTILREVEAAADLLEADFGVKADVWSATSFTELRRDGMEVERWSLLHPGEPARTPYVAQALEGHAGPIVAASDYIRAFPDQIRPYVGERSFTALGTDGFGRSDTRDALRRFFEVDAESIAAASLHGLQLNEQYGGDAVAKAIADLGLDPAKPEPRVS